MVCSLNKMKAPNAARDAAWKRLADDEVKTIVSMRRLLQSFALVLVVTLVLVHAETTLLRSELLPLQEAAESGEWSQLELEWRILSGAFNSFGADYATDQLEPWWQLTLASTIGLSGIEMIPELNTPQLEQAVSAVSHFSQRLTQYNRAFRRLSARAAIGVPASELDRVDLMMLDTIRTVFDTDSLLAEQSRTVLKSMVVFNAIAGLDNPPEWIFGRLPEVFRSGVERLERGEEFRSFHTTLLVKDLRSFEELAEISTPYGGLVGKLDRFQQPTQAALNMQVGAMTSDIRSREAGAAVGIPGLGIRIPPRFLSVATVVVNAALLVLAYIATVRLLVTLKQIDDPSTLAVEVEVVQHRLPWLDSRCPAWKRFVEALVAVLPAVSLLAVSILQARIWTVATAIVVGFIVVGWVVSVAAMNIAARRIGLRLLPDAMVSQ
jgi:hypothetical protein